MENILNQQHDEGEVAWAVPFLLFGIYNKIVKVEGND
ncbi:hypothetical protein ABIE50_005373 [Chitinophaga sp. OAE865]